MQIRNGVRENIVKTNLHQRQTFSANLVDYFYLGKIVDQTRRAAAQNKLSSPSSSSSMSSWNVSKLGLVGPVSKLGLCYTRWVSLDKSQRKICPENWICSSYCPRALMHRYYPVLNRTITHEFYNRIPKLEVEEKSAKCWICSKCVRRK